MGWLTPTTMTRRPGTPGVIVIVADVTASISPANKRRISDEASAIMREHPGARLLAFGTRVVDITSRPEELTRHTLWECFENGGLNTNMAAFRRSKGNEGTLAGKALAVAATFNPERTALLSDGGTADRDLLLRTADTMTGAIDAYYCHPRREEFSLEHHFISAEDMWRHFSRGADRATMQELARRGGGRCFDYPTKSGIYTDYGIRDSLPMGHQRKVFVAGPTVNINAPQGEVRRVVRRIDVYHDTEIHNHYGETSEFHHGEPDTIDIESGQAQINFHRQEGFNVVEHQALEPPRGLLKTLLLGPGRSQYRGELRDAPALPAPTEQPMQQIAYFSKSKVTR